MHLSPEALDALEAHAWPGNIRELANVIERIVLLANGSVISRAEAERFLPATSPNPASAARAAALSALPAMASNPLVREYRALHSHSADELREALARHGGNQSRAAQSLGMTPRQFGYRWRRLAAASPST